MQNIMLYLEIRWQVFGLIIFLAFSLYFIADIFYIYIF